MHAGIGGRLERIEELSARFPRRWKLSNVSWMTQKALTARGWKGLPPEELPQAAGDHGSEERKSFCNEAYAILTDLLWSDPVRCPCWGRGGGYRMESVYMAWHMVGVRMGYA